MALRVRAASERPQDVARSMIPVIAAAGDNAVVAWLAEGNVATARVTTDGGDNWSDATAVGEGLSAAAARVGRLAIAGTREGGIAWVRVWNDGTWGEVQDVPKPMFGAESPDAVGVEVVLRVDNRIGVAYSAQLDVDGLRGRIEKLEQVVAQRR